MPADVLPRGGKPNGERRAHRRYAISLEVEYRLRDRKQVQFGRGRTVNVSTGGILFESERPLPPGKLIELSIAWPWWVNNQGGLKLQVSGRTLRAEQNCTAIKAERHHFLTDSRPAGAR